MDQTKAWQASLRGISLDQIKQTLGDIAKSGKEYPPTMPVFRAMCLGENNEKEHHEHLRMKQADAEWRENQKMLNLGTREDRIKARNKYMPKIKDLLKG